MRKWRGPVTSGCLLVEWVVACHTRAPFRFYSVGDPDSQRQSVRQAALWTTMPNCGGRVWRGSIPDRSPPPWEGRFIMGLDIDSFRPITHSVGGAPGPRATRPGTSTRSVPRRRIVPGAGSIHGSRVRPRSMTRRLPPCSGPDHRLPAEYSYGSGSQCRVSHDPLTHPAS